MHPGAEELCDGLDNDCDDALGEDEVDADGDGVLLCAGDCDDDNALVAPGKPELCGDGLDNDCEGGDATCPPPETSSSASDGEADTGVDFGSEGDSEAGTESAGGSGGDDKGCACGQGSRDGPGGAALLVLAALGLTRRRR